MNTRTICGKVALITGAAGGIGQATAWTFARAGVHLALLDANEAALRRLSDALEQETAVMVHPVIADLGTEAGVNAAIAEALTPFDDEVHLLIAAVGKLLTGTFATLSLSQWQQAFVLNFWSHVYACRAVVPRMQRHKGGGSIIVVGSDQGLQPDAGLGPYAQAKAALHSLVKTLARELPVEGITVSAVAPGMTRTPLIEPLIARYAQEFGTDQATAIRLELQRRGVPVARLGEPEEIAQAILLLATTPFCNGTILNISGGNVRGMAS